MRKRRDKKTNNSLLDSRQVNQNVVIDDRNKLDIGKDKLPINTEITNWQQEIDRNTINSQLANSTVSSKAMTQPTIDDWQQEIDGNILPKDALEGGEINGNQQLSQPRLENNFPVFKTNKSKKPTTIHIIDGEKGGCGKSFICRAFIEYCNSTARDMMIIDADISNRDIEKIYPNVEMAFFSDDEKQAYEADKIFDFAFDKSVLVNLPAQVYGNVTNWIQRNDLVNLGKDNSINFIKWFVATGGVDSVNFFLKSLDDFGNDITHVFVKNYGLCDNWEYVETMPEFVDAAQKYNFYAIDFPKFPFWERNTIDRLEITFTDAILRPELKIVSKQRVKNFLQFAYKAFAKTGLIE
ncbi:hypothetical protein [Calothrix sp. PCC 6303]|uniref:hypothetical protein n=1 Tax=Calothrix sp. PCC 6303 TaxID=1170562 RepID=UPI0002A045FC|nr:hypothetical protein [Calothrix sp. PCC 6303]AFZ01698.1 hypothetical protein Cal6303_2727 [Calothrix sp. PCC 6303]